MNSGTDISPSIQMNGNFSSENLNNQSLVVKFDDKRQPTMKGLKPGDQLF
jgi:hypothetical protein